MSAADPGALAVCTIIARNYLAHARALTGSLRVHHPNARVFVLSVDGWSNTGADDEPFTRVDMTQLRIPHPDQMAFRYNVTELCTAVKPFFLKYLLAKHDLGRILYFDPDIYFYQSPEPLWQALAGHDLVLTPHLLEPLARGSTPSELDILKSGVYNLGFIGVRRCADVETLLDWWGNHLEKECLHDTARGFFVDQRWADLLPAFCERTLIWRDETYNVAYWNLSQRKLTCKKGTWHVNGKPLTFYHFSGYKPENPTQLSVHFKRHLPDNMPALAELAAEYAAQLDQHGYAETKPIPYALERFENGVLVPELARRLWREMNGERHWAHPFRASEPDSFFAWLNTDDSPHKADAPLVTNLLLEIYRLRLDVQARWHDPMGADRRAVVGWFLNTGATEHFIDPAFVSPIRASFLPPPAAPSPPSPAAEIYQPPTFKYRVYYAIRNPLRRLGLHRLVRALLGEELTDRVHNAMVLGRARHPLYDETTR